MTKFVEKDGIVKEIQSEDSLQYYAKGWKDSEKKAAPASFVKRGKRRTEETVEDTEEEIKEED